MAQQSTFFLRRGRLYLMAVVSVGLIAQVFIFLPFVLASSEFGGATRALAAVFSVSIMLVGVWCLAHSVRRLRAGDPAITVGPGGVHDPLIHGDPIPWSEIQRPLLRYSGISGWRLLFDVDQEAEQELGIGPRQRRSAARWRWLGVRSYRVHFFGTQATVSRMYAAIEPYAEIQSPGPLSRVLGRE